MIQTRIDAALKKIWSQNITYDYMHDYLLREDSLKNSLYYHLRKELGDKFLEDNKLRIYTEFRFEMLDRRLKQIGDIVIVRLKDGNASMMEYHIDQAIEQVIAIIELKYRTSIESVFYDDILKLKHYCNEIVLEDTQLYAGFICEDKYPVEYGDWIEMEDIEWAIEKVTQLTIHYNELDEVVCDIVSYTSMNEHLNIKTQ